MATRPSPLASLHVHRRVLGVIGILHCPSAKDFGKAYGQFQQMCKYGPCTIACCPLCFVEGGVPFSLLGRDVRPMTTTLRLMKIRLRVLILACACPLQELTQLCSCETLHACRSSYKNSCITICLLPIYGRQHAGGHFACMALPVGGCTCCTIIYIYIYMCVWKGAVHPACHLCMSVL